MEPLPAARATGIWQKEIASMITSTKALIRPTRAKARVDPVAREGVNMYFFFQYYRNRGAPCEYPPLKVSDLT